MTQRSSETDRARARAQELEETGIQRDTSDRDVLRSSGSMAIATLMSRITGFLRNVLLGASLGAAVFSSFNSANQLPNLITEIVLGAVLTSLVVPVLVRAEKEDTDHGARFIRRLITISSVLLLVVTTLCMVGAPLLARLSLDPDGKVNVIQATNFAYLVMPQIFFYGISALLMAILNTKGVFKPGAWAPVWNNLVVLVVVGAYWLIPGGLGVHDNGGFTNLHMLLLGLGTTCGVVVQALVLIPPLRRINVDLRPEWGVDARLKSLAGMGIAIVVYVAISQVGYFITNRLASVADASAPGVYSQSWLLLQMPYGIIGVTLLTAIMPRLSRHAADHNTTAVVRDLTVATKLTFIGIVPIVVFFIAFGPRIGVALYAYGNFSTTAAGSIGLTLSLSAFTLIPYSLVLLHLRVFYAREEVWTPTFIIVAITVTKVTLSVVALHVAPRPESVVVLLGIANGAGFIAGALIGAYLLRRSIGHLQFRQVTRTFLWVTLCSVVAVGAAMGMDAIPPIHALSTLLGSPGMVLRVALAGIILLIVTFTLLSFTPLPEVAQVEKSVLGRIPGPLGRYHSRRASRTLASATPSSSADDADAADTDAGDADASADTSADAAPAGGSAGADTGASARTHDSTASESPRDEEPQIIAIPELIPDAGELLPGAYVEHGHYRLLSYNGKDPDDYATWLAVDMHNTSAESGTRFSRRDSRLSSLVILAIRPDRATAATTTNAPADAAADRADGATDGFATTNATGTSEVKSSDISPVRFLLASLISAGLVISTMSGLFYAARQPLDHITTTLITRTSQQ